MLYLPLVLVFNFEKGSVSFSSDSSPCWLVLTLCVVSPQIVTVNCARLIKPDQHATNGIVHVVDRVITAISNNMNTLIDIDDDLETLRVSTPADQ